MTEPAQLLDYAKSPPVLRRRIRRIGIVFALVMLIFAAVCWWKPVYEKATFLYLQHQCMNYQPPANVVVYESDPARAAILMRSNPTNYKQDTQHAGAVFFQPDCLQTLDAAMSKRFGMYKEKRMYAVSNDGPVPIFLHGMRTPSGDERLLVVESGGYQVNGLDITRGLSCRIYQPAGIFSRPRRIDQPRWHDYSGRLEPAELGVGVADRADRTHFTIPYSCDGQSGTIDGWLGDNAKVHFVVRDGPGK